MLIKDVLKIDPSSLDFNNPEGIKVCFEHLCNLIEALQGKYGTKERKSKTERRNK